MTTVPGKDYTEQDLIDFFIDSARYGDTEDVRVALKEGVKLDAVDEAGRTALHMSAANGEPFFPFLILVLTAAPLHGYIFAQESG